MGDPHDRLDVGRRAGNADAIGVPLQTAPTAKPDGGSDFYNGGH